MPTNTISSNAVLVSIIMPAYNASKYIAESIQSVLTQTFQNWELIVVDDGSTDDTANIVKIFAIKDYRIRLIRQVNGRQGKARNTAIAAAHGELLAFLDADDLWHPNKLKLQLNEIRDQNVDLVFSKGWILKGEERILGEGAVIGVMEGLVAFKQMLQQNRIPILTVLVRKESVIKAGGFGENATIQNAEDYHLWLSLLSNGCRFFGMAEPLAFYRIHGDNITGKEDSVLWPTFYTLLDLKENGKAYCNLIESSLQQKLLLWFNSNASATREQLVNFFALWFRLKKRKVPLVLNIFTALMFNSFITPRLFRHIYFKLK